MQVLGGSPPSAEDDVFGRMGSCLPAESEPGLRGKAWAWKGAAFLPFLRCMELHLGLSAGGPHGSFMEA